MQHLRNSCYHIQFHACVDKIPLVKPKDWGFILIGLSLVFILFWLSLQWIITQDLEVQMFHFSYSKPSRAFNKLNWAYAELVELNTDWLHIKTCIHLVNNHLHSHNYTGYWSFIFHQHQLYIFSTFYASSLLSLKFVWMMSCRCSLLYSAILLMLNEIKVHLTSKYVTLVTARQCQPKFFLLEHLYKLK